VLGGFGVYSFLLGPQQKVVVRASVGDTAAQSELAENYFTGADGFSANAEKHRYWLERAARSDDLTAKARLGLLLAFADNETDVLRGRDLLMDTLRDSPIEQKQDTMFMLALSHALVKPFNPQRAAGWYQRAYHAGSLEAQEALTDLLSLQAQHTDEDALTMLRGVKQRLNEAKNKVEQGFYVPKSAQQGSAF
jgi:TPR repeat protein